MAPRSSGPNVRRDGDAYSESISHIPSGFARSHDAPNIILGQFGPLIRLASLVVLSILGLHVGAVFGLRPGPQMVWITASAVRDVTDRVEAVAGVKNAFPFRDRSLEKHPGEPVSQYAEAALIGGRAVSAISDATSPQPTPVRSRLVQFFEELLYRSARSELHRAGMGAELDPTLRGFDGVRTVKAQASREWKRPAREPLRAGVGTELPVFLTSQKLGSAVTTQFRAFKSGHCDLLKGGQNAR